MAAAVVALLLTGTARAADPAAAPASPDIVVGAVYAETGPGQTARDAIATALDIVNGTHEPVPLLMGAGGGLDRLGNAKLVVDLADEAGNPAAAAERLVTEQHAAILIGGTAVAAIAAISHVAERHGLPYLALGGSLGNADGLTWFFRLGHTPARDAKTVVQLLGDVAAAHGHPLKTVALAFEDGPAGRDRAAPVRAAAEAAGLQVVDAPVPPGQPITPLPSAPSPSAPSPSAPSSSAPSPSAPSPSAVSADAVLSVLGGADEPARLAALAPAGPLVLLDPDTDAAPDGSFRRVSFTANPLPRRPGVDRLAALFKARTGHSLDADSAREITGILLLADVVNRAGSTKPIDLRTALMATDTPGSELPMLWDGIRFDDSGQNVRATPALQQMQAGAFTTVLPDAIAVAAPHWPAARTP